ncbi:MAG: sulfatase [Bryobacterales bacterium]|nr:sulfatase [Bryobacterales bacterium]
MSHILNRRRFLSAAGGASLAFAQQGAKPPNIIVLFADDMGYGDMACYGHPTLRTPNFDRMAQEGMRMTSFYAAAPVCTPSRVGLLTGRYPVRAGQPNNLGPDSVGGLRLSEILLPQLMKQRGYKTMMIGKWHLGHNPEAHLPTSRGFDGYLGLLYSNDMIPPWVKTTKPLHLYRNTEPIELMEDQSTLTERYTDEAVKFIRESARQPFFLYLPYAMPHLPISAAKFKGKSRAGLYGDVIETIDWSVGQILEAVKQAGVDSNTLIVFTTDNGPWHNLPDRMLAKGVEPWHTGSKGLLRGAKGTTWEGGQRVPCLVRWPGVIPPRQVSMDMASTLDLLPTLVKAAGGKVPDDRTYDGADLMAHWQGKAPSPRKEFFYFLGRQLQGLREGAWKCSLRPGASPELFDLDVDPAELYNRYEQNKELGDRMLAKMTAFAAELGADFAKS